MKIAAMKHRRSSKEIKELLPRVKHLLEKLYGDRLEDVILYGSFARGQADQDSDIDIAVVLKGPVHKPEEIDKIYDVIYELMLESGELISVFPVSEHEIKNRVWPLYHYIRKEGVRQ